MMTKIKFFIRRILCNGFTGNVLTAFYGRNIPDIRWKGYRFQLPAKGVSKTNIAAIFWGFYEAAEIRLIEKYLEKNSSVVELGASVGVVTSHIISRMDPGMKLVSVEANPRLIENITSNMQKFAKSGVKYQTLNYAVQYSASETLIHISNDNTESRVGKSVARSDGAVAIKTITLKEIIEKENLENFSLVCDIEGSEIELILLDAVSLRKCKQIFIELHDTVYGGKAYTPDEMLHLLLNDLGFKMIERQGAICCLQNQLM
jgi:FkbM family methyltransferase